jgi:hypothetical protein
MLWKALTGMLIGITIPVATKLVADATIETLAMTLLSGCAVPICDVPDNDNSIFPAAAFA